MTTQKAKKEVQILDDHLSSQKRKQSRQRKTILDLFVNAGKHVSPDELYRMVQKKHPRIGFATIYRTLHLFCECGLSRALKFNDGITRFEPLYGAKHHDHLICTCCGQLIEVVDPQIELLQEKLARAHGFRLENHRLELYGICRKCKK